MEQYSYKIIDKKFEEAENEMKEQESGNMTGYSKITKPENHTWKSFCNLLLASLPKNMQEHYIKKFKVFIKWWKERGYPDGLPEEAPPHLEVDA